jgi:hypothetical protein
VAEWLGRALQKLVQRFESAQRLFKEHQSEMVDAFFVCSSADENRAVRNQRFTRGLCGMYVGMSNPLNASSKSIDQQWLMLFLFAVVGVRTARFEIIKQPPSKS